MKCSNCGKEVPERAIVCGYCGEEQAQPAAKAPEPVPENVVPAEKVDQAPKPAPKKAVPAKKAEKAPVEDKLPQAKKFPVWVWGIVAVVVLLAVLLIPRSGIDERPLQEEIVEDWFSVHWECEEEYLPADKALSLWGSWGATTQEQIDDFYNTVRISVYVNDEEVDISEKGLGDRWEEYYETIDADLIVQGYYLNIGLLEPGEYEIVTRVDFTEMIEDGIDTYGPGTGNEYFERFCFVIVEE